MTNLGQQDRRVCISRNKPDFNNSKTVLIRKTTVLQLCRHIFVKQNKDDKVKYTIQLTQQHTVLYTYKKDTSLKSKAINLHK